ncbi:MAG: FAD-binding oxidoreductase [Epsilonproteobacteria bacterium]|nr:FAD-binding oxidoreductase [Campylobacterota bacterium]
MHYDAIILGAGIAGASTAYFLQKAGLKVLLLEKSAICSGGSYAAGAFLSPKISKPSPYKNYLNDAFNFSIDFYKQHFSDLFYQCGLQKIPLDKEDRQRCESYEPFIDFPYTKERENYFFPDAGIIHPRKLCQALLEKTEVKEYYSVKEIIFKNSLWHVDQFSAIHLILATAHEPTHFTLPYIKTKKIAGYRYDVRFDGDHLLKHNIHKDLSISSFYDNTIAIGATHIKSDKALNLQEDADYDSYGLLQKAQNLMPLPNLEILKSYTGIRSSTLDYFPIVGSLIDAKKTLTAFPYIQTGAKVPADKYIYHPQLYIHTALGSRGFVFAPYNAKRLTDLIIDNKAIESRLSPTRLFHRWATKRREIF